MTLSVINNLLLERGNDLTSFFWPSAYFIKESILKFHAFPLWQPMFFSGMPLLGDPQNLSFYLPNFLFLILPISTAFMLLLFSHLIFAGLVTYLLLKNIFKTSSFAALITAIAFVLSPKIFSHLEAGHYTILVAFSWLPLLFLFLLKFIKRPTLKKSLLLAIILTIIFLNHANIFYFSFLFMVLWILFEQPKALKLLPFLILFFLGFSSFQLLPQLELGNFSNRRDMTFNDVAQPLWSFKLFFQSLFFPYLYGLKKFTTESLLFPGLVVSFFSFLGFFQLKKRLRLLFLFWIIFSLLYSLGARIPFFIFFYKYFPLTKFMRTTTRLWIISIFLITLMAGLGLDWVFKKFKKKQRWSYLLGILLIFELIVIDFSLINKKNPGTGAKSSDKVYQFLEKDPGKFRLYCTTDCLDFKEAVKIGKASLGGNNPVQLRDYIKFLSKAAGYQYNKYIPILPPYEVFSTKPQPNAELMGLLNTKYILSPYPLSDQSFILKEKIKDIYIYENTKALGQAFLKEERSIIPLDLNYYSANKITVKLNPQDRGELILSEIFYPGWESDVDGKKVTVQKKFEILRSINIEKGSKEAVFIYSPKSFKIGLAITLLTILFSIFLLRNQRKNKQGLKLK